MYHGCERISELGSGPPPCYVSSMVAVDGGRVRRSWLSVAGALALSALGVVGIGSLMVVKDRLRVEVSLDAPETDSLALVRDDFKLLQTDFTALTQALEQQSGAMAAESARQSAAQAVANGRAEAALAALDRRLADTASRLQAIERALAEQSSHDRAPVAAAAHEPAVAPQTAVVEPVAAGSEPQPMPAEPKSAETKSAEPKPAEPDAAMPKVFLGFKLPSRSYRFDQAQAYEILPELSRVGFDAKSTLHDFSGVTTKVRGTFHANLASPGASFTGTIACDAAALDSGVEGRDEAMREHLAAAEHPAITFTAQSFVADADGVDVAKMTSKGSVTGTMRIRGVEKQMSMPVTITVDGSRRVRIEGQAKVHLPDYGVPVPDKVVIKMQPDVDVWIALRARPVAGGADAK